MIRDKKESKKGKEKKKILGNVEVYKRDYEEGFLLSRFVTFSFAAGALEARGFFWNSKSSEATNRTKVTLSKTGDEISRENPLGKSLSIDQRSMDDNGTHMDTAERVVLSIRNSRSSEARLPSFEDNLSISN